MSFEKVRALLGQKDQQGYQIGLGEMVCNVLSVSPKKWNKRGKPIQKVQITDEEGETQKVTIYLGNGPDILDTDVGTLQRFNQVKPNSFKNNTYYQAFWSSMSPPESLPNVPSGPEPPLTRQTPQNPPQSPNAPEKPYGQLPHQTKASQGKNEYNEREDARQLMIVRQSSLEKAKDIFIAAGGLAGDGQISFPVEDPTVDQICQLAEKFKDYVYTKQQAGFEKKYNLPPEPTVQEEAKNDEPPPTDEDGVPF